MFSQLKNSLTQKKSFNEIPLAQNFGLPSYFTNLLASDLVP